MAADHSVSEGEGGIGAEEGGWGGVEGGHSSPSGNSELGRSLWICLSVLSNTELVVPRHKGGEQGGKRGASECRGWGGGLGDCITEGRGGG